jgi:hypothetical protein
VAVRQINSGITDTSALNVIRLECNGGGILMDQAGVNRALVYTNCGPVFFSSIPV